MAVSGFSFGDVAVFSPAVLYPASTEHTGVNKYTPVNHPHSPQVPQLHVCRSVPLAFTEANHAPLPLTITLASNRAVHFSLKGMKYTTTRFNKDISNFSFSLEKCKSLNLK